MHQKTFYVSEEGGRAEMWIKCRKRRIEYMKESIGKRFYNYSYILM